MAKSTVIDTGLPAVTVDGEAVTDFRNGLAASDSHSAVLPAMSVARNSTQRAVDGNTAGAVKVWAMPPSTRYSSVATPERASAARNRNVPASIHPVVSGAVRSTLTVANRTDSGLPFWSTAQ